MAKSVIKAKSNRGHRRLAKKHPSTRRKSAGKKIRDKLLARSAQRTSARLKAEMKGQKALSIMEKSEAKSLRNKGKNKTEEAFYPQTGKPKRHNW